MANRLKGKTALITGASRGIGLAIAQAYAAEGANLVLNARDQSRLTQAGIKIQQTFGVKVACYAGDVADRAAMFDMVNRAEAVAPIDILVNNAGIHKAARFIDYTPEDFQSLMEVNFFGVLHVTQAVLPAMMERKSGRVVNIGSTAGKWGSRNQSAYNASKHAVVGLTRCLGLEMAPYNVLVNAICPWFVETDLMDGFVSGHAAAANVDGTALMEAWRNSVPIKRWIQPAEVAHLAVYLGSDESSYINGQAWTIDGGYTMI